MNAGEMTDEELLTVADEAEELLAGASMRRSADVVGELRRRYLLMSENVKVRGEGEGEGKGEGEGEGARAPKYTFEEHRANNCSTRIIHTKRESVGTMTAVLIRRDERICASISDADGKCVVVGEVMAGMTTARHVARSAMRAIMKRKKHLKNMHAKARAKKTEGEVNGQDQQ